MSRKSISLGFGIAAITVALASQAIAGPSCNTGYSFGSQRTAAVVRAAPRPAPVLASKPAPKQAKRVAAASPVQSGGDGDVEQVRSPKPAPKVAQAPVSAPQKVQAPEAQPAPQQQAAAPAADQPEEGTSVAAVAARLAALSAQQAAAARKSASGTQ